MTDTAPETPDTPDVSTGDVEGDVNVTPPAEGESAPADGGDSTDGGDSAGE